MKFEDSQAGWLTQSCRADDGAFLKGTVTNKAEIEYAIMLAVLDFQTEFMKSAYSQVQAYVYDDLIYVTLARSTSIPAEQELARSPEGHELLCRFHRSMFDSCQHVLQDRIEQAIGAKIHSIVNDLHPIEGRSMILIRLCEPKSV